jgi:glycosyltransferase involved in cell wall biosynthesis
MSRARARLLFLVDQLVMGGSELQLVALLRGLDRGRYDVHLAQFRESAPLMRDIDVGDTDVVCLHRSRRYEPSLLFRLAALMRRLDVDLVYTVLPTADIWGRLAGCLARRPALVTRKGTVLTGGDRENHEATFDRLLRPFTDRVIVNSQMGLEDLVRARRADAARTVVIHNGTDCERFSPPAPAERGRLREELGVSQSALMVAAVGRLSEEKGWVTLIEAVARLPQERQREVHWMIAGDGPLRPLLEERIARHALSERVHLLGFRRDVPAILGAADVVVLPSYQEGIPNVLCEAMAMARPVVATRVGGVPELVEEGRSGLLVEPKEPQGLADALDRLLADPHARERLGRLARQRIVSEFSLERMVGETDRVLQTVLAHRAAARSNGQVVAGRR